MAVSKAISASGYRRLGRAITKMAYSKLFYVDQVGTDPSFNPTGGIFHPVHEEGRAWSTTGSLVDSTGSLLFNNETNGGYLSELLIANRGSNTIYVGLNSTNISTTSGFPLASGESMTRQGFITAIYAVTQSGFGTVAAQGIFGLNSPQF